MRFGGITKSRAFVYAVAVHVAVVIVLITRSGFDSKPAPLAPSDIPIVKARAVDQRALDAEVERLKQIEAEKQRKAREEAAAAEKKRREEERKLEELKQEQERLKREAAEQKRRQAEEQKRQAEEKKRQAEKAHKEAEERKRKEEAERAKALEEKRIAEERKKAVEKKAREEAEKRAAALKDALASEEAERAAAKQQAADDEEIARYIAAIRAKIANVFIYPDMEGGLSCTLYVRMIPGGDVVEARVIRSSGNETFDRQAENAVRKAAPLPVPSDPRLFQRMREIKFVFEPEQ